MKLGVDRITVQHLGINKGKYLSNAKQERGGRVICTWIPTIVLIACQKYHIVTGFCALG